MDVQIDFQPSKFPVLLITDQKNDCQTITSVMIACKWMFVDIFEEYTKQGSQDYTKLGN